MTLPSFPTEGSVNWYPYATAADIYLRKLSTGGYVAFWAANEAVTAGDVRISPTGDTLVRVANGTTRPTFDATELATWTVVNGSGGGAGAKLVANTASTSTALAINKHTPVDATSGPLTMTLPAGQLPGTEISVEKIDDTTNVVSVSGSIHDIPGSLATLTSRYESILLRADTTGDWWVIARGNTATGRQTETRSTLLADIADEESAISTSLGDWFLTKGTALQFASAPIEITKATDTARTNATLANDPELLVGVAKTNWRYRVKAKFYLQGDATADFKAKWVPPTGATMKWHMLAPKSTGADTQFDLYNETQTGVAGAIGQGAPYVATIEGYLDTSDVGGTLRLQWAQNTTNAYATTMFAGSLLSLTEVGPAPTTVALPPAGGVTLPYTQAFTGLSAWPSEWTTTGTADVTSSQARLITAATTSATASAYLSGMAHTADVDVTVDYVTPATLVDQYVAIGGRSTGITDYYSDSGYWAEIRPNSSGAYIGLYKATGGGGATTMTADAAFSFAASTTYHIRFQAIGTTVRARIWTGGTEPTTWNVTATDSTYATGRTFLSLINTASAARTATFDNYGVAVGVPDVVGGGTDVPIKYNNLDYLDIEGDTVRAQTPGKDWSFRAVSDAKSVTGATYLRFELRSGDRWDDNRQRCETRWYTHAGSTGTDMTFGVDWWFSHSWRWSGTLSGGDYCIIMQCHQSPDPGDVTPRSAPVLSARLEAGSGFTIETRGDTNYNSASTPPLTTRYNLSSPPANTWNHMVYRVRWSKATANGILQVWRNGSQIIDVSNFANAYNDDVAPGMKMGIYRGGQPEVTTVVEYANPDISLSSLSARVASPEALPNLA